MTRREQKSPHHTARKPERKPERKPFYKPHAKPESGLWLYGLHAVRAALANPKRFVKRAVLTERAAEEIGAKLLGRVRHEVTDMHGVSKILPEGAVHQGVALLVEPQPRRTLESALAEAADKRRVVLVLDQITDPQNAGAILRTAAAFGVAAVIVQDRHSPPESGVLAKAASGALDSVPLIYEVNIARALEELGRLGFWRIALAGDGETTLRDAMADRDIALVLGSEGSGIRRLVRERCDVTAYVPIEAAMESLNVSNAAAIALYEARRG
ncbi:MAG TPA: 23S rRNA (guanosine(2251)-2'-O)-methyltransferase RlmB [Rhizomicrobium sp.]|nr:23S rRNA (guanosine(2251)-2'-O)-methyltransferase RlmB [Rhizomicrobium sp.]